jgi:hypothetical protein
METERSLIRDKVSDGSRTLVSFSASTPFCVRARFEPCNLGFASAAPVPVPFAQRVASFASRSGESSGSIVSHVSQAARADFVARRVLCLQREHLTPM